MLMDVIPLDATLVKGSHGRPGLVETDEGPLFMSKQKAPAARRRRSTRSTSTRSSSPTSESEHAN